MKWAALILTILGLLLVGCGGSGSTTTVTAPAPASGTTTAQALDPASAQNAVTQYYGAIDNYAYGQAWGYLGTAQRQENQGFQTWKAGYVSNVETNLRSAVPTVIDSDTVAVAVRVNTVDVDACGDDVRQTFEGTWTVDFVAGRPLLDQADISKVGGGEPATDTSGCPPPPPPPPSSSPPPPPPDNCDPSYPDFCIPPPPPDLDCPDVGAENFTVEGDDPHGFDADYDGVGCETYP